MTITEEQKSIASYALYHAFGEELRELASDRDFELVASDFLEACEEDGISATEYRNRIGRGNLQAYADCLTAGIDKGLSAGAL